VEPSGRSAAGHRLYTDRDLDRLQLVSFYRALEVPLEDIVTALADPGKGRREVLLAQRALLVRRLEGTRATLALLDDTLRALEGGSPMEPEEMFATFDPKAHEAEAEARWGETEAFRISKERTAGYGPDDWAALRAEASEILAAFAALSAEGVPATDDRAADLGERYRLHLDRWFYPTSRAHHAELARMYVDDPRFSANFERIAPGLASYVRDAILTNALRAT
jgi:DNA-binding transcriptional MerR regulator